MQRRSLLRGLIALAVGGTLGKFAAVQDASDRFRVELRYRKHLSGVLSDIYGRAGVGPEHLDFSALRPTAPSNVVLADRRGHDDDYVIEWQN